MGLIANYQYLSDENLKAMKNFDGEEDELLEDELDELLELEDELLELLELEDELLELEDGLVVLGEVDPSVPGLL